MFSKLVLMVSEHHQFQSLLDLSLNLIPWHVFQVTDELEMMLDSDLVLEDIKLLAETNVLPDDINIVD